MLNRFWLLRYNQRVLRVEVLKVVQVIEAKLVVHQTAVQLITFGNKVCETPEFCPHPPVLEGVVVVR